MSEALRRVRFLAFAAILIASTHARAESLEQLVDRFVEKYRPAPETGIAVAVIQDGSIAFFKGYGYRDRSKKLPVTPHTLFQIGSNTKSFTAFAMAMLAAEGRLSLDAPVRKYLPDFELSDASVARQINLVDILSHRSGLPRHDLLWYFTPFSRSELYRRMGYLALHPKPEMGFRQSFQYNNLMYMTAGVLIERLTGKSWEEFTSERIFTPLGMTESGFSESKMKQNPDFARPFQGLNEIAFRATDGIGPAGSIHSNVTEMSRWIRYFLEGGVSPEVLERLTRPETDASKTIPAPSTRYGLGWFLSTVAGKKLVWHGGNIDGFSTHVSFMPDAGLGLLVFVADTRGSIFEFPIEVPIRSGKAMLKLLPLQIYEHLLGEKSNEPLLSFSNSLADLILRLASGFENLEFPERPSESLPSMDWVGSYSDVGYGDLQISERNGRAYLSYYTNCWELHSTEKKDQFLIHFESDGEMLKTPLSVSRSETGQINGLRVLLEPEVDPIFFRRNSSASR